MRTLFVRLLESFAHARQWWVNIQPLFSLFLSLFHPIVSEEFDLRSSLAFRNKIQKKENPQQQKKLVRNAIRSNGSETRAVV